MSVTPAKFDVRRGVSRTCEHPTGSSSPWAVQIDDHRPFDLHQLRDHLIVECYQLARANQQAFASCRKRHATGGARDQRHAQLLLEAGDLTTERLLGNV